MECVGWSEWGGVSVGWSGWDEVCGMECVGWIASFPGP